MKNILNKKNIIIAVVVIVLLIIINKAFFNKEESGLVLEKVKIGTIIQEVSETGTVRPTEEIELGFKTAGRIEKINVKVGDMVEKGAELASLDRNQLFIQLSQAQASLAVAQSQYNKLSEDDKNAAEQSLDSAYQDALNVLDDAYLKIYNTYNAISAIQISYFTAVDQEGARVQDNRTIISESLSSVKPLLDTAKASLSHNDIDAALSKMEISLKNTSESLKIIREICEQGIYYTKVSSADKTIIDNHRGYAITALTSVNNSQQAISSGKIAFQKAKNEIDYYQAKVEEVQTSVDSLKNQILDAFLRAPIKGTITKVNEKVGETVQAAGSLISLISSDPLQIKLDIYEEDIVKVQINNLVDIKIAAFPNKDLTGKVIAIDPGEKLVDGIVYYEVTISFDRIDEGLKPGMTADVVIQTANKQGVLIISKEAVRENGGITVLVYKDGKTEEREIQIGLEGNENMVEIISGLSEGEEVVIK